MAVRYELTNEVAEALAGAVRRHLLTPHLHDDRDVRTVVVEWLENQVVEVLRDHVRREVMASSTADVEDEVEKRMNGLGYSRGENPGWGRRA